MAVKKVLGIALTIFLSASVVDAQEVAAKRQKDVNDISVPGIELSERQKQPDMAWWRESMKTRDARIAWWHKARFGMFIHWGVYAGPGGEWKGQKVTGYAEHLMRKCKIPRQEYLNEVVGKFNPVDYNPAEWVAMAKAAGMGYIVITAKHHDGFAMYNSAVSDYDIVDATPYGRDVLAQLRDECLKQGIQFGIYYSHAFDWEHPNAPGNDWEYKNPGGDLGLFGGKQWYEEHPELLDRIRGYVDQKSIPQVRELIRNYHPSIIWFDTAGKLPGAETLRILKAVREESMDVIVNSRVGGEGGNYGDYRSTADRPAEFAPVQEADWEGIPTTNESYGYSKHDHSHKPPAHFIQLLAKAVSRGGNLMMNIGPMGNGQFAPEDQDILREIAVWMKYYKNTVVGAERSPLPVQNWGAVTRRDNTLYLHVFEWPADKKLMLSGLANRIVSVHLLNQDKKESLSFERFGKWDVLIEVPSKSPHPADGVIELTFKGEPIVSKSRVLEMHVMANRLHVFDSDQHDGVQFLDGKKNSDCTRDWKNSNAVIGWNVRVGKSSTFALKLVSTDTNQGSAWGAGGRSGTYELKVDDRIFTGSVNKDNPVTDAGQVTLAAGEHVIRIRPLKVEGAELTRLRCIDVIPIQQQEQVRLWYTEPAKKWEEALPIGNGRLGAMVFGGVPTERLQLNEDTLYSGYPGYRDVKLNIADTLSEVTADESGFNNGIEE